MDECETVRALIKDKIKLRDAHIENTIGSLNRKDLDGALFHMNEAIMLDGSIRGLKSLNCPKP